ncbi:hypothetical protein ACLM5H_23120 [Fredinandcohnia humi]
MKVIVQSLLFSFILHFVYLVGPMIVGSLKTAFYTPDITGKWQQVDYLQTEVAFGLRLNQAFFIISYFMVDLINWLFIVLYKKRLRA